MWSWEGEIRDGMQLETREKKVGVQGIQEGQQVFEIGAGNIKECDRRRFIMGRRGVRYQIGKNG